MTQDKAHLSKVMKIIKYSYMHPTVHKTLSRVSSDHQHMSTKSSGIVICDYLLCFPHSMNDEAHSLSIVKVIMLCVSGPVLVWEIQDITLCILLKKHTQINICI